MPGDNRENKTLDNYFRDVDKYSQNHFDDISRFSKLLDSLKKEKKSSENNSFISDIEKRVVNFNGLISRYNLQLTDSENDDITAINESKAAPLLKLRMLEDLFHKIQKNHKNEIDSSLPPEYLREIEEFQKKKSFFMEWIHLIVFAINFRTITVFTHNIRESSLAVIKNDLYENIMIIKDFLKNILDREYYIFSITEYNLLALMLDLENPILELRQMHTDEYYNPHKMKDIMHQFTEIYLKIIANAGIIDEVTSKLTGKRKLPHGFYGAVKAIIEQPLHNGKTLKLSHEARMTKTATGTLLSYYTSLEKKLFTGTYQIQYLLNISTAVDSNEKHLTGSAAENEQQRHTADSADINTNESKYRHLARIFDYFIPLGLEISERMLKEESFSITDSWHKSYESKAMYYPVQLTESLVKHFTERINTPNSIVFRYDHREFSRFFEHKKEIFNASKGLSIADLELTAANLKEMFEADPPPDIMNDEFIFWLLTHDNSYYSNMENYSHTKSFVRSVQSRAFSLASVIFEVIEKYENHKEINFQLTEENYDFFINAEIAAHRQHTLNKILGKDPVTVEHFLTALCALSFYIAQVFSSGALIELRNEMERLRTFFKSDEDEITVENTSPVYVKKDIPVFNEAEYTDSLTGLFKFQYFNDILKPQQYSDALRFNGDINRILFFLEIQNFQEINNLMGHDIGDQLLIKCCRILIESAERISGLYLFRYKNANVFGIFPSPHINEAAEFIQESAEKINKLNAATAQHNIKNTYINCGIFEERKTSVFSSTFELTRRLMYSGNNVQANNIVMIKNKDVKISKKDFLPDGSINPSLLKILQ